MDCGTCGKDLLPGAVMCDGCGAKVQLPDGADGIFTHEQWERLKFHRHRLGDECDPDRTGGATGNALMDALEPPEVPGD